MNEKDLEQQLAEVEYRRLQGKLSYEEAILARQNCIQENQKRAEEIREEVLSQKKTDQILSGLDLPVSEQYSIYHMLMHW